MREVVEALPGEDIVPLPGPLSANNRVYWGKLPREIESDLVDIGALVPDADMLRASPVLLSQWGGVLEAAAPPSTMIVGTHVPGHLAGKTSVVGRVPSASAAGFTA